MISCLPPSPPPKGKIFLSQSLWFNDSKFLPWGINFSIWKWLKVMWTQVWWQRQLRPRKESSSRCPGSEVLGSCIYVCLESPWARPWMPCGGLPGDVVFVKLSNHFPREKLADTGVSASQLLVGSLCQWGHCGGLLCHQLLVSLLLSLFWWDSAISSSLSPSFLQRLTTHSGSKGWHISEPTHHRCQLRARSHLSL